MAYIIENFVVEEDPNLIKMLMERGYGTLDKQQRLVLSPLEALYLLENKRIDIELDGKKIGVKELMSKLKKKEKNIDIKYEVYSDLRNKGYIIKTGYGFGTYLRVYEKGIRPGEGKSHYLVHILSESEEISILDLNKILRIAQMTKKNLVLAIVRENKKINYIKINPLQF